MKPALPDGFVDALAVPNPLPPGVQDALRVKVPPPSGEIFDKSDYAWIQSRLVAALKSTREQPGANDVLPFTRGTRDALTAAMVTISVGRGFQSLPCAASRRR